MSAAELFEESRTERERARLLAEGAFEARLRVAATLQRARQTRDRSRAALYRRRRRVEPEQASKVVLLDGAQGAEGGAGCGGVLIAS